MGARGQYGYAHRYPVTQSDPNRLAHAVADTDRLAHSVADADATPWIPLVVNSVLMV